jgi:hypothetical protein
MKKNDIVLIGGFALAMAAINIALVWTNQLSWSGSWDWKTFGTMVGAAVTVAVLSQLYKDNALFKLAEHMLVGSALGYGLMVTWYSMWVGQLLPGLFPATFGASKNPQLLGRWSVILPAILGLAMYSRLSKKYAWISRVPFAVMIGFGVGMSIPNEVTANLLQQLKPMMTDLAHDNQGNLSILWNIKEIVILIGVMATLVYFFFSVEHKGAVGAVSRVGIFFVMVAFGASFGYTVMGRLSLLIGRVNFLFRDWIPLIP